MGWNTKKIWHRFSSYLLDREDLLEWNKQTNTKTTTKNPNQTNQTKQQLQKQTKKIAGIFGSTHTIAMCYNKYYQLIGDGVDLLRVILQSIYDDEMLI